ncbi:phage baseplate assembly protein V [Phenylobacterium sp.]|uniref:phage baseplate assembly protein V n=1 Tax=Phenylobacterium sp. TaxID=1871053 RepID=UPI0035B0549F
MRGIVDRLMFAIGRGRVTVVDDAGPVQRAQVDLGPKGTDGSRGLRDRTPLLGLFGFASNPPPGSDVVVIFPGGERSNGVGVAHGHQVYRLTGLKPGDAAVYDQRGAYLWFGEDGLHVSAAGLPVLLENATTVTVKASGTVRFETDRLEVTGDIVDRCDSDNVSVKVLRAAHNGHRHGTSDLPDLLAE